MESDSICELCKGRKGREQRSPPLDNTPAPICSGSLKPVRSVWREEIIAVRHDARGSLQGCKGDAEAGLGRPLGPVFYDIRKAF
jgi:hypothetical protein